ncbi:MAG TPA: hypothetical protein ENN17_00050 [bacterium]|nr:hypothetical protein [bacterium]
MQYGKIIWPVVLLNVVPCIFAQELTREGRYWIATFSKSVPASRNGTLQVDGIRGDVAVKTWDRNEVRIAGRLKMDIPSRQEAALAAEEALDAVGVRGDTVRIQGRRFSRGWMESRFEIMVPVYFTCETVLGSGSVSLHGLAGPADLKTGGGSITVTDTRGPCRLKTGGGPLLLKQIEEEITAVTGGGAIEISDAGSGISAVTGGGAVRILRAARGAVVITGGGDIDVSESKGKLQLTTGGGNIRTARIRGSLEGTTGGGSIVVTTLEGDMELRTGGGDIRLSGITGIIQAKTGSGNIDAECLLKRLPEGSHMELESGNGNITLSLLPGIACTIDASVPAGRFGWQANRINSEFPLELVTSEDIIRASGHVNGGGPKIRIVSGNGNIHIRRMK